MKKFVLRRPSPALVVAFIALLVALGGRSFAAFSVPNNSIGTKQLKNGAVSTKKIKGGAVTKAKLNVRGVTVPNATNANHAAIANAAKSAGEATKVGHNTVRKIAINVPVPASGSTATRLFTLDGLTVTHICENAGFGNQDLTASALQVGDLKIATTDEHKPSSQFAQELSDFGPGSGTTDLYSGFSGSIPDSQNVIGRLIWTTSSGKVLTFDYQDDSSAFGGGATCALAGDVVAG